MDDQPADVDPGDASGQAPIGPGSAAWLLSLASAWAVGGVVTGTAVEGFGVHGTAFLRFLPAVPLVAWLARRAGARPLPRPRDAGPLGLLGVLFFAQIATFNGGATLTTGPRVVLLIFTYPLLVPLVAPLVVPAERFRGRSLLGAGIAFAGVAWVLGADAAGGGGNLAGDALELLSALLIALNLALTKRLCGRIDKWVVLLWRFAVAEALFLAVLLLQGPPDLGAATPQAWAAVVFQAVVVSVFCFLSFQVLLTRHNSSDATVFLSATPLLGVAAGAVLLDQPVDPNLVVGGLLAAAGIVVAVRR